MGWSAIQMRSNLSYRIRPFSPRAMRPLLLLLGCLAPVLVAQAQPGTPTDPGVLLDLTVALQGAYDTGSSAHRTTLRDNALVPATQPYGDAAYDDTPIAYDGAETNPSLPATVVDWIVLEARTSTAATDSVTATAALLLSDGSVVAASGSALPTLSGLAAGSYFVVVRHRAHLAAISATAVDFSTGTGTLDLTAPGASLGASGTVEVESGVRALWAADGSVDGLVTAPDFNVYSSASASGVTGYRIEDYTMDGLVTAPDFNLYNANAAAGAATAVPEN
ncbi:MAG: hypothetical protein Rubg2KO_30510 [Rubricoccaceae bacterium]